MNRRDFFKFLPAVPASTVALALGIVKIEDSVPKVIHTDGNVTIQDCIFNTHTEPGLTIIRSPEFGSHS